MRTAHKTAHQRGTTTFIITRYQLLVGQYVWTTPNCHQKTNSWVRESSNQVSKSFSWSCWLTPEVWSFPMCFPPTTARSAKLPSPPDCQAVHIAVRRKMRSSISGLVAIMDVKDSVVRTLPTWNVWNVPQHSLGSCGVEKCPIRITKTTLQRFAKPYSLWPVGSAACWWRTTATSCPGDDVRRSVECGAALASPNGFLSKWESYYPPKHRLAW